MSNPNILLQGLDKPQGMDALYRGAAQANEIAQAPMQNALLQQRVEAGQQGIDKERAAFQLQDAAIDAYQVKQLLQTDPARAKVYLANRFKKIQDRGGDPSDTAGVIQALDAGNLDFVNAELDAVIGAAQQVGLFGNKLAGTASARTYEPVPLYENGKFVGMGMPTYDPKTGRASYTPIEGGSTVDPATLAGMKSGASTTAQNVSNLQYKPLITEAETESRLGVEANMRPGIEADIAKAKAEAEDLVQQTISRRGASQTLQSAQVLKENLTGNLASIYGRGESLYPTLLRSQKGIDLLADRNQLIGMLSLAARGQLKGQGTITDQEAKTLQEAVSVLSNQDISPARAEIALEDAFRVMEASAGRTAQQQQPTGGVKFMGFE